MERKKVRIITFAIAAFAILVGALIYQYSVSQSYLNYIRNSNMRSFYDFVDYVKTIDSSLEKGIHSNSPNQLVNISSEIWREAGGAQASLAQLPLSSEQTADVSKFLAQTGDYAYMLSKKVANNEVITPQEQDQLEELSRYAKALTSTLFEMEDQVNSGNVDLNNFNFSGQYQDVSNVDKGIG